MLDISDLYAMFQDRYEQQEEIPDWAPRSACSLRNKAEENYITRVEKRLCRKINYGECSALLKAFRGEVVEPKRFIDRARKCPECGKWHTDPYNRWGICPDCIPF